MVQALGRAGPEEGLGAGGFWKETSGNTVKGWGRPRDGAGNPGHRAGSPQRSWARVRPEDRAQAVLPRVGCEDDCGLAGWQAVLWGSVCSHPGLSVPRLQKGRHMGKAALPRAGLQHQGDPNLWVRLGIS